MKQLLIALFLPALVAAATLTGVVKDPSGAVVAAAGVIARNTVTNETRSTSSSATGAFTIDNLAPGQYLVAVQKEGFETAEQRFTMSEKDNALTFNLKIAQVETAVEVTGKRSALANSDPNYRALRDISLTTAYSVENFSLTRDVGVFTFRNGHFAFAAPVLGRTAIAVFTGEASFSLKPAIVPESKHLELITGSQIVEEEFESAVFVFTDGTGEAIVKAGHAVAATAHDAELLRDFHHTMRHSNEYARSLLESMLASDGMPNADAVLLGELYNPGAGGSFSAFLHGRKHAHLRFVVQPRGALRRMLSPEESGLFNMDPGGAQDGIWYLTHLGAEWKSGTANGDEDKRIIATKHYTIETTLGKRGRLSGVADLQFEALRDGDRVLDFGLLASLRVTRVLGAGGKEISFIQEGRRQDGAFYVVLPEATVKGHAYTLHMEYEGNKVVNDAGGGSMSVGARESWYPSSGPFNDHATYDLTFKVPRHYTLVSIGKLEKEWREDDYEVTHWICDVPVAVAGFNYGDYKKKEKYDDATKYNVEAYATAELPDEIRQHARGNASMSPSSMANNAVVDAQNSVRIFERFFGPLPFGRIAITQQPQFFFGQSWPTLVYLPVSAFLDSTQRYMLLGSNTFRFSEFIDEVTPHEVSHQWWGHVVGWSTYHDQWLSEGFADFSAGLFLQGTEKTPDKYIKYWERARKTILEKNQFGKSANEAGPIWMGLRLDTFKTGSAYQRLVYPKGGYVLHMLRTLMYDNATGDDNFIALMHDFVKSYAQKNATTEDFMEVVNRHMTKGMDLEGNGRSGWFFREWVYDTQVPRYHLDYTLTPAADGKVVFAGKLTQSDVSAGFKMRVPVYGEFDGHMVRLLAIGVGGNSTTAEVKVVLPKKPKKVVLNAFYDVLCSEATASEL